MTDKSLSSYCVLNDVANEPLYLAFDDAKFVNGHNLVVDGGLTSHKGTKFSVPYIECWLSTRRNCNSIMNTPTTMGHLTTIKKPQSLTPY